MVKGLTKVLIFGFGAGALVSFAAQAAEKTNLRNLRYCEVIASKSVPNFALYNTMGLNDCPANTWKKISNHHAKKATGSTFVHLNGPRYWVVDSFTQSTSGKSRVLSVNGLSMYEAGDLHMRMRDLLKPNKSYQARDVNRRTTWVYQAGKPVYELIDPQGTVYIMQSYSVQRSAQSEKSLGQLGAKLKLPNGWKFKTGLLKKTQSLGAIDGMAIVVQDEYLNTYQKAGRDFLL